MAEISSSVKLAKKFCPEFIIYLCCSIKSNLIIFIGVCKLPLIFQNCLKVRSDCDGISLLILLLQTGCGSILTSETTSQPNSAQTSQLFVGLKLPTSICFGIYLLPNYGTKNIVMIKQIHFSGMINV